MEEPNVPFWRASNVTVVNYCQGPRGKSNLCLNTRTTSKRVSMKVRRTVTFKFTGPRFLVICNIQQENSHLNCTFHHGSSTIVYNLTLYSWRGCQCERRGLLKRQLNDVIFCSSSPSVIHPSHRKTERCQGQKKDWSICSGHHLASKKGSVRDRERKKRNVMRRQWRKEAEWEEGSEQCQITLIDRESEEWCSCSHAFNEGWVTFTFEPTLVPIPAPRTQYRYKMVPFFGNVLFDLPVFIVRTELVSYHLHVTISSVGRAGVQRLCLCCPKFESQPGALNFVFFIKLSCSNCMKVMHN